MKAITIVLTLTLTALAGCSTQPSVHVPPDAPTPLCADVPACHDQLCRIDPSGDPAYCDCGGVRCLKGSTADSHATPVAWPSSPITAKGDGQ